MVRAGHPLAVASGGETETLTMRRAFAPPYNSSLTSKQYSLTGRSSKGHADVNKTFVYTLMYDKADTLLVRRRP